MSELRESLFETFRKRRQNILNGNVNSIPSPFVRFSDDFIGIEQATYYLITSFTKGGKSQFTSYLLYRALLFCHDTKADIRIKILYFNLEETKDKVLTRFTSWLLYERSGHKYRCSPRDLMSSKNTKPISQEVLDFLDRPDMIELIDYFTDHIIFSEEKNPTGIYKFCKHYAEENGTVYNKPCKFKNSFGVTQTGEAFDHYIPNDPNEYVLPVIDTINIVDTERGFTKKQSIDKLSEYLAIYLRNRYGMSPIVIQQQNTDNESVESVKFNRTRPTIAGLGDSKYTGHDANIVIGLYSPFKFGIKEYAGYDVSKLKDHLRFAEVLVNRDGEMGGMVGLFFDGAICDWNELPRADDVNGISSVYKYLNTLNPAPSFFISNINKFKRKSIIRLRKIKIKL